MEPWPRFSDSHNHSQAPDKTTIEREISGKVSSHPEQMVEDRRAHRRPGLGLFYNRSPIDLTEMKEKAKQVVPVDSTVLDHISDPDAFVKKAYELEAAVAEIQRLSGEAKKIGERVLKAVEDDPPRRCCPGLGLQMKPPKFVPLPMRPSPIKVQPTCMCQNSAPAQSTGPPETTKVTDFSGSQNKASSSISNATNEVPEMYVSSSFEKLFSNLESIPKDDEEKAIEMVLDLLNLKKHVIPPLVIPEIPNFSRLVVERSSSTQLPSIERLGELRELRRKILQRSPAAYDSDDDTNPLPRVGSVRSLSTSPSDQFSFENKEIDTPSHAGPSGSPNVEMDEFPSQEKVREMTSEARGGNFSDNDDAGNDMPDEPEMHSPWDDSPVNIEVAASGMPMENPPVNIEVSPSAVLLLEYQPEVREMTSEARGGNFSDNDDAGNDMPDEPEMHSPWDDSPVNIEVAVSRMPMENPPVNVEVSPSAVLLLEYQPEQVEVVTKESSSRKGKKRGLEHAERNDVKKANQAHSDKRYHVPCKPKLSVKQQRIADEMASATEPSSKLFVKMLSSSDLQDSLIIPSPFARQNIGTRSQQINLLVANKGKVSPANYNYSERMPRIGSGWKQFAHTNNIKKGNLCLFEVKRLHGTKLTIVVHIPPQAN